jgi:hypothetical protein
MGKNGQRQNAARSLFFPEKSGATNTVLREMPQLA